jgi:hypothetical protein
MNAEGIHAEGVAIFPITYPADSYKSMSVPQEANGFAMGLERL